MLAPSSALADEACISRYFTQLERFCAQAPAALTALEPTAAEAPAEVDPAPATSAFAASRALLAHCPANNPSALATGTLAARQQELLQAAKPLELELGAATETVELATADYLSALSQRVATDSSLRTGAAADALVNQLLGYVCKEPGVRAQLPNTCGAPATGPALLELRRRLLLDLVTLPRRAAQENGRASQLPAELRAGLALLSAAVSPEPVWHLLRELAPPGACGLPTLEAPPASDTLTRAAQLLQRILADGMKLDRPASYYRLLLENELRRLRGEAALSPSTQQALQGMLTALTALRTTPSPQGVDSLQSQLPNLVLLVQFALSAVSEKPSAGVLPPASVDLVQAALRGELAAVLSHSLSLMRQVTGKAVTEAQVRAMDAAVRLALASDEDEAQRILRAIILPLPRWSESILFDINADVPSLERGNFRVVGDALLGYNAKTWGITGQGSLAEYDFSTPNTIAETTAVDGGLEAWLAPSLGSSRVRLELRLFGKTALYDTNRTNAGFSDETSLMGRGGLLTSIRYQPNERFAGGLWLGAGAQYEWYDTGAFVSGTADLQTTENVALLLNARARVEISIVPRWLVSRLRIDMQRYAITRSSLRSVFGMGMANIAASSLQAEQLELRARLFLDAEVARVGGFVPSLNGGFDSVFFNADAESYRTVVPVVGVGFRREAF